LLFLKRNKHSKWKNIQTQFQYSRFL